MATTLANLRDRVAQRFRDEDLDFLSTTKMDPLINAGERDVAIRSEYGRGDYPLSVAQWDQKIALPADTLKIYRALWLPGDAVMRPLNWLDFVNGERMQGKTSGSPNLFTEHDENLYVYPAASAASVTAAVNDAADVTSTATTITYDGASSALRAHGYYKIDSEWIKANDNSTTQLKNCKRGWSGTTAAAHLNNAGITQADILVIRSYVPAVATATVNTSVPDAWTEAIVLFASWKAFEMDRRTQEAVRAREAYFEFVEEMRVFYSNRMEEIDNQIHPFDITSYSGIDIMDESGWFL